MDVTDLLREELKQALRRVAEAAGATEGGGRANVNTAVAVNVDAPGRTTVAAERSTPG